MGNSAENEMRADAGHLPAAIAPEFSRVDFGDALVNSIADAVVASDAQGRIVLWNAGAERIFGFSGAEALGQSLDIIVPENLRARHWAGYDAALASGHSHYGAGDLLAVPGLHKDGHRISLEFTITMLKGADGKVCALIAVLRDVTKKFSEMKALKDRLAAHPPA